MLVKRVTYDYSKILKDVHVVLHMQGLRLIHNGNTNGAPVSETPPSPPSSSSLTSTLPFYPPGIHRTNGQLRYDYLGGVGEFWFCASQI